MLYLIIGLENYSPVTLTNAMIYTTATDISGQIHNRRLGLLGALRSKDNQDLATNIKVGSQEASERTQINISNITTI